MCALTAKRFERFWKMDLCDYNTIKALLSRHNFKFNKSLGQNFLIDPTVCPKMVKSLNIDDKPTGTVEIGPGVGVLTKELSAVSQKVVSVEIDKMLLPVLSETLSECDNVKIINGDILKMNIKELVETEFSGVENVSVCANLPYYITSPVIMAFVQSNAAIDQMVFMVQKETAERFCAPVGSRQSGAVTVILNYYAKAEILFDVPKTSFMPSPKVDSAVISITPRAQKAVEVEDEKHFIKVIKAAFLQRRKTAVNSISAGLGISKNTVREALNKIGIDERARVENFSMQDFATLSTLI